MAERRSRGRIAYDAMTDVPFQQLVEQTLEESEFIEVDDEGVIYEIVE